MALRSWSLRPASAVHQLCAASSSAGAVPARKIWEDLFAHWSFAVSAATTTRAAACVLLARGGAPATKPTHLPRAVWPSSRSRPPNSSKAAATSEHPNAHRNVPDHERRLREPGRLLPQPAAASAMALHLRRQSSSVQFCARPAHGPTFASAGQTRTRQEAERTKCSAQARSGATRQLGSSIVEISAKCGQGSSPAPARSTMWAHRRRPRTGVCKPSGGGF